MVNFAEAQKWTTGVKLPRMAAEKTRLRFLSDIEEEALFAAIDPKATYPGKCERTDRARQDNTDLLIGLLDLGARYREVARMTWGQVDLEARKAMVLRGKGGVDNTLMMTDRLYAMFARRKAQAVDEWVFPSKRKFNNNYKWLEGALERAGISEDAGRITLHTARHTCASRLLQGGLNLQEVQHVLGHKHYASTLIYSHIETGAVAEKAAKILNGIASAA